MLLPNWLTVGLIWFPVLALVTLAGIFVARQLYRELPFYFLYLLSASLIGVLRYVAVHLGRKAYFYSYWISDLTISVIFLLAFYEVFLRRLFPRFYKVRFYRYLFPVAASIILLTAIITALQAPDRRAAFLMASRGFDFMRTAVLTFLMLLMVLMGRNWTRYDFGISLGFGIQAAIALINSAVRTWLGHPSATLENLEFIGYNIACLIWLITFWKPERALSPGGADDRMVPQTLQQARKWEQVLKDLLTPGKRMPR
jgi:hypothetical protein